MALQQQHVSFQINHHVQITIMLLPTMDSAEIDLNNTLLSSHTISNDYEKDLRLAAELGRCLLEQNQELKNYIHLLQKQIDEKDYDTKLLNTKLLSTREQFDAKCKQMELLDAVNFDLEQELTIQRRENDKNRQQIKDLLDLCEISRQQYEDLEHEYENLRVKQVLCKQNSSPSPPLSQPIFSTPVSTKRQRSNSFTIQPLSDSPVIISSNLFDSSSTAIFKSHLTDLKSRIHSLTNECSSLNDQLHRSEQEKSFLINRLTQLERQHRDEQDSFQNELDYYRKLAEKQSLDQSKISLTNTSFSSEQNLSLYDEVLLGKKSSYEPTNYKELFARVYAKLKTK